MQLRPDQLAAHLAAPGPRGLAPVYTLCGDDPLLTQEAADAIRAAARAAGHAEREVLTLSGAQADWSGALAGAQAMSLFADRRLVEWRVPSGKPGKEGSQVLQRYAADPSPDVLLIVHLPRADRDMQKAAWFAALQSAGPLLRIDPLPREKLAGWLAQRLRAQGQQVEDGEAGQRTLAFLADRVEGNLLAAHQEVQKLGLLHPRGVLTHAQVSAAVLNVARYDVFKLGEAVLAGQVPRALRMLDGLRAEGEAPVLVHWTLADDIRTLARVRDALDRGVPLPAALQQQRVWGAKEALVGRAVQRLDAATLAALVAAASACDGIVKGLRRPDWPLDAWGALKRLTLMTMQPLQARGAAPLVLQPLTGGQ